MRNVKIIAFLCLILVSGMTQAKDFYHEETFDNPADYEQGNDVPSGWISEGTIRITRQLASWFGITSHSGDYVFGTVGSNDENRNECFYIQAIKLKGGAECVVSFWLYAPGGVPASVRKNEIKVTAGLQPSEEGQTIDVGTTGKESVTDWTQYTFRFTPDADGDYYIRFSVNTMMMQCGTVAFDDIIVEGQSPDDGGETVKTPYSQSFDNENGDYDGTTYLPKGWLSTGTQPFVTASIPTLPAATGEYYMITDENKDLRDERAYTPFFEMKAGETYRIAFKLAMPGNSNYGATRTCGLTLTAGNEQASGAQTEELYAIANQAFSEWRAVETEFTPTKDGRYCFAFNLFSTVNYTGIVAIDDVVISKKGEAVRPTADFTYTSWFDIMTDEAVVFEGAKIKMINLSKDATDYLWTIDGAVPETSTEKDPEFSFSRPGSYNITMTAKNEKYSKTTYRTINVSVKDGEHEGVGLMGYNVNDDKHLSNFIDIPKYATDPTYDFVSGINHYYRRFAERFELPEDQEITLTTLSMWLATYSRRIEYTAEERNHPFTISVYGETDGQLDETKLFGRKTSTVVDEFGDMGVGLENPKPISFDLSANPIKVKGNFYVAFEFDDRMPIDSDDPNIVRSFVSFGMMRHKSEVTTLYAKPTAGPAGFTPDGKWCPVDRISPEGAGCGLYMVLWGDLKNDVTSGMVAIGNDGSIAFAARMDGDDLNISGTHAGDNIMIYDINGRLVKTARAEETLTQIRLSDINQGLYIVKSQDGSAKFIKQ